MIPWMWTFCSCIPVVCRTGFCSSGVGCYPSQTLLYCLAWNNKYKWTKEIIGVRAHEMVWFQTKCWATVWDVYLYSNTDSSWRGQTTFSSIASNQSCPAGETYIRFMLKQLHVYMNLWIVKHTIETCFFVEPSSDDHRAVGISPGRLTSFPKSLHPSITFLLAKDDNNTYACTHRLLISCPCAHKDRTC